jgi:hypothetical protein
LGVDAVQFVTKPDPERVEGEGLEADVDLALEEFAKHLLQAAARCSIRHPTNLVRGREDLPSSGVDRLAGGAAGNTEMPDFFVMTPLVPSASKSRCTRIGRRTEGGDRRP